MSEELTIERIRAMRAGPTPAIHHAGRAIDFLLTKLDEMREALSAYITDTGHTAWCNKYTDEEGPCISSCTRTRAALAQHGTEEKR